MASTDLQPYQNGSDGFISILKDPVGQSHAISRCSDGRSYTSIHIHCAAESHRMDTHTPTNGGPICHNRQKIGSVFT